MKNKSWTLLLVGIFVVTTSTLLLLNLYYKNHQYSINTQKIYAKLSSTLTKKLQTLIEEKKNATLTISLALAQDQRLQEALLEKKNIRSYLKHFSNELRHETDFKNVWFQLLDQEGVVVSRSWSEDRGDHLLNVRALQTITKTKVSIDVDQYDLSFKARVPILDAQQHVIGFLETITHFNSIAKKIAQEGFKAVVVVDKNYGKKLQSSFLKYSIDGYHIANNNVDPDLLDYIQKSGGIEPFLDYKSSYTIEKGEFLVVHHTLFDPLHQAIAYILLFQKLNHVDTSSLNNLNLLINTLTLLSIVFLCLVLILFYLKEERGREAMEDFRKHKAFFVLIFLFALLSFYLLLEMSYRSNKEKFFIDHNRVIQKDYDVILNKYQTVADIMYDRVINQEPIKNIIEAAYTSKKDEARAKLYTALIESYNFFQVYDLRQLHFHLKNNESFLRFHRPGKYGDNLTGVRSTIEWVNANHLRIDGFEEGRIFNGFRHVYPLTLIDQMHKEYLGSVEVSFSAHSIAQEFARSHSAKAAFFIVKDVVKEKVFESELTNYKKSPLESFYYECAITKQLEYDFTHSNIQKLSSEQLHLANQKILKGELFTLLSQDDRHVFTFVPLHNPVTNKIVASILIEVQSDRVIKLKYNYIVIFAIGTILILLTTIFIYREYQSKWRFQALSWKTKRILDTQKSIIVITNGRMISDVNQTFLDFLGFENLAAFKIQYRCVCELFIEHENYFHLGKVPDHRTWVEQLDHMPDKDKVVLIKDYKGHERSLAIAYSHYKEDYYIVTFNDISGTMHEQITLQKKLIVDPLTQAFNRAFFTANIDSIVTDCYAQTSRLGILFFDIDHFKNINDRFGHNVGDEILKELVAQIKNSIRESDFLIRWGGEEFIVLLPTHSIKAASKVAEHLRKMIEEHLFKEVGHLTCSLGVTLLRDQDEDIYAAIKRADEALYCSKESGRNSVSIKAR